MHIDTSGNVGIGDTTPDSRLWIQDTGGNPASGLTIANNASHNWSIYRHNVRGGALAIEGEGTAPGVTIITANPVLTLASTTTVAAGITSKIKFEFKDNASTPNFPSTINPSAEIRATVIAYDSNEATASLSFHTQNPLATLPEGLTQKMVIMDSGNVGIGTDAPSSNVEIAASDAGVTLELSSWDVNTKESVGFIRFQKSRHATIQTFGETITGEWLGSLAFYGSDSSSTPSQQSAFINVIQDGAASSNQVASYMSFGTGTSSAVATERMRITAAGQVLVNTEKLISVGGLDVLGGASVGSANLQIAKNSNNANMLLSTHHTTNAYASVFMFLKSGYTTINPNLRCYYSNTDSGRKLRGAT